MPAAVEEQKTVSVEELNRALSDFLADKLTSKELLKTLDIKEAVLVYPLSSLEMFLEIYENNTGKDPKELLVERIMTYLCKDETPEPIVKSEMRINVRELKAKADEAALKRNYCEAFFLERKATELLEQELITARKKELSQEQL
jgi:hypothetical protein